MSKQDGGGRDHKGTLNLPKTNFPMKAELPKKEPERLARYVGLGRAKRMILSGDGVNGAEALAIGLVDHLVPADATMAGFGALVDKYMAANSEGCRLSKQALEACFDLGYEAFLDRYMDLQARAFASPDFAEAMAAYRAKRVPDWR